jgi:alkanesulfonate monooxygenase SsuD/methylene tetrahydromethanopterin reductase-like flavin-dependent oxidoreductase (luciferase family)
VLIGGGGERKTLRHVARYATIWHAFGGPETQARKAAVLAGHCAAIGRDPAEIERSTALPRGRADDAASTADTLIELGVTLFTIGLSGPDYDLSSVPGWLAWRDRRNADRA